VKRDLIRLASVVIVLTMACSSPAQGDFARMWEDAQRERPAQLQSSATIAPSGEKGVPLRILGRVWSADGTTPMSGVTVFAWQTDADGHYNLPRTDGWRLRGWAVTGSDGRFEFRTVRPGPYPSRREPAHVHFTLDGPGVPRQWTASLLFDDDPLISPDRRRESAAAGRFATVRPVQEDSGGESQVSIELKATPENRF
jgi:protocatechuate 3,4-dioxygenase, beta subunit